jgi:hypothetical protein
VATVVRRHPSSFEAILELDESDRAALRDEIARKWHHTRPLWFAIVVCSMGAAVQGWDQVSRHLQGNDGGKAHWRKKNLQTGSNRANLSFPIEFGIGSTFAQDKWLVGLINSTPTIAMTLM